MATSGTYYIDTADFSTATAVWTNTSLTTKAPDGYYSFDFNFRRQFNGALQAISSCSAPPPPDVPSIGITSTICNTDGGSTVTKRFRISVGNPPLNYTIAQGTVTNYAGLVYSINDTPGNSYLEVVFRPSVTYGSEFSIELLLEDSTGATVATNVNQTVYGNYQSFLPSCS